MLHVACGEAVRSALPARPSSEPPLRRFRRFICHSLLLRRGFDLGGCRLSCSDPVGLEVRRSVRYCHWREAHVVIDARCVLRQYGLVRHESPAPSTTPLLPRVVLKQSVPELTPLAAVCPSPACMFRPSVALRCLINQSTVIQAMTVASMCWSYVLLPEQTHLHISGPLVRALQRHRLLHVSTATTLDTHKAWGHRLIRNTSFSQHTLLRLSALRV